MDPPGPALRAGGTPVANDVLNSWVPPRQTHSLAGTTVARGEKVPPGQPHSLTRTTVAFDDQDTLVPPSMSGSSLVPDAEVSMWARPSARRRREHLSILSPRREANRPTSHVYGPSGEDLCLVCPNEGNSATHVTDNTESVKPIFSIQNQVRSSDKVHPSVTRDERCEARDMDNSARRSEMYDNVNSAYSENQNMTRLSAKLAECSDWLKSPLNVSNVNVINNSVADCLEQVSALLCKMSLNSSNVTYNCSNPRSEPRQVYQTLDPGSRPRGEHVPLFTSAQSSHTANGRPARERLHGNQGGVAPDVSRLAWNTEAIGPRMPCGYEAEYGVMNELTTTKSGGKLRFQPGSIQHKIQAQGVAAKSIEQAIDGEFCELSDFLSPIGASNNITPNLECIMDDENRLLYRTKRHSRKITNCDLWCQAWALYEKLLIGIFGIEMHSVMSDYRQFIMEANRKFVWSSIATYDFRHRSRLSANTTLAERLDFSSPSHDLVITILDATAVKPNAIRCNRCKAYDHVAAGCPFPETLSKTQEKSKGQSSQAQNEICFNFNRDRCTNERCRRIHRCRQCRGPLPLSKCSVSGTCASQSKAPATQ